MKINSLDSNQYPLHYAAYTGNLSKVKEILEEGRSHPSDVVNFKDNNDNIPLFCVVASDCVSLDDKKQLIDYLIEKGSDINYINNRDFDICFYLLDSIFLIQRDTKVSVDEKDKKIEEFVELTRYLVTNHKPDIFHGADKVSTSNDIYGGFFGVNVQAAEHMKSKARAFNITFKKIARDAPIKMLIFLLEQYPKLLVLKDRYKYNLLNYSIEDSKLDLVQILVHEMGSTEQSLTAFLQSINFSNRSEMTQLKMVLDVAPLNIDIENTFLKVTDNQGNNLLHKLAMKINGDSSLKKEAAQLLLTKNPLLIDQKNNLGKTPLDLILENRDLNLLTLCLSSKLPIESFIAYARNIVWSESKEIDTLVEIAVLLRDYPEIIEKILEHTPPDIREQFWVMYESRDNMESYLPHLQHIVEKVSNITLAPNAVYGGKKQTRLHLLVNGPEDKLDLVLADPDLDINARDINNETALHYAVKQGKTDVITKLLAHPNIDVNAKDNNGNSILHYATQFHLPFIYLIKSAKEQKIAPLAQIDLYNFNSWRESPFEVASRTDRNEINDLLAFDEKTHEEHKVKLVYQPAQRQIKTDIIEQGAYKPLNPAKKEWTTPEIIESAIFLQDKQQSYLFDGKAEEFYQNEIAKPLLNLCALAIQGRHDKSKPQSRLKAIIAAGQNLSSVKLDPRLVSSQGVYTSKHTVFSSAKATLSSAWATLVHELGHFAAAQAFKNSCTPYFELGSNYNQLGSEVKEEIREALKEAVEKLAKENIKNFTVDKLKTIDPDSRDVEQFLSAEIRYLINVQGKEWMEKTIPKLYKVYVEYFTANSITFFDIYDKTFENMKAYSPQKGSPEEKAKVIIMNVAEYGWFQRHSELIVRVPQILAELGNKEGELWLSQHTPELLDYYKNVFNKQIEQFCKQHTDPSLLDSLSSNSDNRMSPI